ncbi:MAG: S1 RNA-binding domain-containing protein [Anaerolineales bacterium]|nr:S1 RNA-binding domain-containing protein [Anaerolineales bacterium]
MLNEIRLAEKEAENPDDMETAQFAELLDAYGFERFKRGDYVKGEVLHVEADYVLVDIGGSQDAVVPSSELRDLENGYLENLSKGDRISVKILQTAQLNKKPQVSIKGGLEQEDWERAQAMLGSDETVELEIVGWNEGGLLVAFNKLQGFVPNSLAMELRRVYDRQKRNQIKREKIGDRIILKVVEVQVPERRLVLSELETAGERRKKRLRELNIGDVLTGKAVNLVKFGAFVDLDGVEGLVHISELAWYRVNHPGELIELGEEIEVQVLEIDVERERVSLSHKLLLENPWDEVKERYQQDDLVQVTVSSVQDYGVFARLPVGVDGLIHVSELTNPEHFQEILSPGDRIFVRVIDMNVDEERVSLSERRVAEEEKISLMMYAEEQ